MASQAQNPNQSEIRDGGADLSSPARPLNRSVRSRWSFWTSPRPIVAFWCNSSVRGPRSKVARSLSTTAALALIAVVGAWLVPGIIDSREQRMLHRASVHRDGTVVRTGVTAAFAKPVTLYYRNVDGTVHLLLADEGDVTRFVNENILYLDDRREAIKTRTSARIEALFAKAFADREASIGRYADWYFEWGRSWALLKEASIGGFNGAWPNNVQGIFEASQNQVEAYLVRNYSRFVLKPELRDPVIEAGISEILADAQRQYLDVLTNIDDRVQDFLSSHTRHLETLGPRAKVDVSLDWDAQRWKAPRYSVDDEAFRATARFAGIASVSALTGVAGRAVAPIFANAARSAMVAMRPQLMGIAAGSRSSLVSAPQWAGSSAPAAALHLTTYGTGIASGSIGVTSNWQRPRPWMRQFKNGRTQFSAIYCEPSTSGSTIREQRSRNTRSAGSPQRVERRSADRGRKLQNGAGCCEDSFSARPRGQNTASKPPR